ncbi:MAG: sulfatase-like hydrolase/transferase [Halovenus sp.]
MTERNNVLLVVLDSVRAENTSLHGYGRETTPFLSDFADRSTVYTQARAPGIHSIASHVSMFTGTHVEEHGALHHTAQIDPSRTVWHELETEFGYTTGLFTNNRIVSDASNLSEAFGYVHEPDYPLTERLEDTVDDTLLERAYYRGYDTVSRLAAYVRADADENPDDVESGTPGRLEQAYEGLTSQVGRIADATGLSELTSSSGYKTLYGGTFTDAFLEWESRQDDPWAVCLNLMDAHSPYEPKSEFDRWATDRNWQIQREEKPSVWETLEGRGWDRIESLEPLYDGTIRQTDEIVRDLVANLEDRGLLSETTLVITSDHGEAFGERSRLNQDIRLRDHKWGIHEVLTHVPLVVSYPDQTEGTVVDDVVSLTDMPAVLRTAATDESGTEQLTGEDVALASTFRLPKGRVSKYSSIDDIDSYVGPWRAVYETRDGSVRKFAAKGEWHVTLDIDHAGDATVVSREDDGRVAKEYDRLADSGLLTQQTSEIDDEVEQQLEDLGYIR